MTTTELARRLDAIAESVRGLKDEHEQRVARMIRALQEVRSIQGEGAPITRQHAEWWLAKEEDRCDYVPRWRRDARRQASEAFNDWWNALFEGQ